MRGIYLRYALLLTLLALGGCSAVDTVQGWIGKSNVVEPAKLQEISERVKFRERWHADLGETGLGLLQPGLTSDAVYGVSGDGRLTRLDRATGRQVWRVDTGVAVSGGVGVGESLVLIGSNKGEVLAYGEDGQLRWKSQLSSEVLSAPQVAEGVVIVRSGDGNIAGLNVADGTRRWLYERATPALVVRSHAGVTIQWGVAFAGFAGGKLAAIRAGDGSILWEVSVSQPRGNTELERISDITGNPAVDDEQVCAIAFQGRVACYEGLRGNPLWNRDISSDKGMMLLRKHLYLSDDKGAVMMLDKLSGATLWKNDELFLRKTSTPHAIGDVVVVADYEGYLHALNRDDGRIVGRINLGEAVDAPMQRMDDGLLVQTRDGDLYSLSIQ
ncbi:MAG: outer membrane protein assembly factor BamB [Gallionella sp.]|jgi:outer membrane protein assembly factor BamB|nr:outer membrane protein assembly factor BamB [Gallionella sp.]